LEKISRTSLIEERKRRRWSQQEVADRLGTTQNNVSRWELGITTPHSYFRSKLCTLFGKSEQELGFCGEARNLLTAHEVVETALEIHSPSPRFSKLWNLPYPRNPFFTGREEFLRSLHTRLHQEQAIAHQLVISGLGGIGKTQITLEYAYRYRQDYAAVFWVNAATREMLLDGMVTIAELLQLPGSGGHDYTNLFWTVKEWFATHNNWLLILDNVEDITLVHEVVPPECPGHLLLTTREQCLGSFVQYLEVEKMATDEGIHFLLRRVPLLHQEVASDTLAPSVLEDAATLVQLMDGLPLALDQAGAYIDETGCDLAHYCMLYHHYSNMLLDRRGRFGDNHPYSVVATFSLSLQQIAKYSPLAADLLRLCAFLSPDAIPEEIFLQERETASSFESCLAFDALALNEAFAILRRHSLIKRHAGIALFNIHRLVQTVIRTQMDQNAYHHWAHQAIRVINRAFPAVEAFTTWPRCQRLLSHALACVSVIEEEKIISEESGRLLHQTGAYLLECAQYPLAEAYITQARIIRERVSGPEHPDVAESLNYVAELAYHKGQYHQSEQFHLQALNMRERLLGPEHPDVATSLHNLAGIYWVQGRYVQAEPLYLHVLQIREKVLGREHLDVGETLQNIAYLFYEQGRYLEAEPLYQRALLICQQVLGPDHAYLTTIFNNLGQLYQALGRIAEAEKLYQRAKVLCENVLDRNHPYYALTLHNLAGLMCANDKWVEAERLYHQALQIRQNTLGSEHPRTARSLHDLATLYTKCGREVQAACLYQEALSIKEKTLGPDHPDTTRTRRCYEGMRQN
jgi:tetratricopeptide (TPR) repeat protein/transcriptional regulator with XRE-family HTH domain